MPPYHAVNILVRASLARCVRVAEINGRPLCVLSAGAPLDTLVIGKLGAIVDRYRFENLIESRTVKPLEAV